MINFLLVATLLLFSLGQLGRISFFNQQINIYLYEIGVVLVLIVMFFKYKFRPFRSNLNLSKTLYMLIGILLVGFFVNIFYFNSVQNLIAGLYFIRLLMYLLLIFYLLHYQPNISQFIVIFTIITIVIGVTQYFLYPDLRNLYYDGWDPHLYRVFSQFFDTSIAGAIYGLLFLYFIQKKEFKYKKLNICLLVLLLLFIVFTFSRSLYIAFVITTVLYFFHNHLRKFALGIIILFILFVIIAPKPSGEGVNLARMFSINTRVNDYKTAIKLWSKQPIFGYGYNHIREVKNTNQTIDNHAGASFHSSFLNILVTGGIVGLMAYLFFLYQLFWLRINGKYFGVFLIIMSCFDNVLLHPFILFLVAILLFDKSQSAV
ncbi:hypothetical protein COZ39_04585 [Candidatus Roizmanbacteria bacterium CG_4_10_14_3_um_filter_33_21]|uniref:O-antigen ligase-related domain-containing protein n=1 Tax=Candidatus Roizmanbacteria bacterium CG_4_10_14_3_um_filter_33_21 TaxID=1974830 RepID=A0A2M7LQH9_9BACT|nr:MAG: hypothetical protein COZ39_04585 [Candidatus Roizmanbacteria bacterium CG_4_10_14_3_um_filter_33_21]